MKNRLTIARDIISRNWMKIALLSACFLFLFIMTSQGLAGPFEGPYPPPGH